MVTAKALAEDGFEVAVYGMDAYAGDKGGVTLAADLSSATTDAMLVVLPLPVTQDEERLHCPLTKKTILLTEVFDRLTPEQYIIGGKVSSYVHEMAKERGLTIKDYLCREELAVANAVPTAEGALAIAMAEVPYTIHGASCLILGYGRVGKTLARALLSLGADVTVAARKPKDLAWIDADGASPLSFDALYAAKEAVSPALLPYDIVFNTVPYPVIDGKLLSCFKKDVLLLDLASAPGGFDHDYVKAQGYHAIWALSLPGKVAPVTAGKIIRTSILEMLREDLGSEILRAAPSAGKEGGTP